MKAFKALLKIIVAAAIPGLFLRKGIGFELNTFLAFVLFVQYCFLGIGLNVGEVTWRQMRESWFCRKIISLLCLAGSAFPAFYYFSCQDQQMLARLLIASNLLAALAFLPLVIVKQPTGYRNVLVDNFCFPNFRILNPLRVYHINQSGILD